MLDFTLSVFCPHCHQKTALSGAGAKYQGAHGHTFTTDAVWEPQPGDQWWIGVCNACNKPCLVKNYGEVVFPNPLPSPSDKNIPEEIRLDLDEAKMCSAVKCYRACAVMARRCIQLACLTKGCTKENLVDQIKELTQNGHITKEIEEWATVVRWVGNDAAHPNKQPVTQEDAEDCLKLAEQFLHVVFVTTAIAKARRTARGK